MKLTAFFVITLSLMTACVGKNQTQMTYPVGINNTAQDRSVSKILTTYAKAWRGDEEFKLKRPTVLAFWVNEQAFSIRLDHDGATLIAGPPETYDLGFETDITTLRKLDSGLLNALTAMGQARADDPTPLILRLPDDFSGSAEMRSYYIPLMLHFWNREWPEAVPFGEGVTRFVHGANATAFVYDKGLRSAWYQLKPGMHINADAKDQVNDFDTAIIITRGSFQGKLNGVKRKFNQGELVLIPEGMTHEFFAEDGEYGEFIILMWGKNA